jgi:hypothetical protein
MEQNGKLSELSGSPPGRGRSGLVFKDPLPGGVGVDWFQRSPPGRGRNGLVFKDPLLGGVGMDWFSKIPSWEG